MPLNATKASSLRRPRSSPPAKLRALLAGRELLLMPCCFDALSARLIEQAGFGLSFMTGFGVSAARIGAPDTGLISYAEMVGQGRDICAAVDIPVIGDADTGYGNALNIKRTLRGYAQAGFAGIMIEDQVAAKRCGHTSGKQVVDRKEATQRIRAAVDARDEGAELLIVARTDARQVHGMEEALWRISAFQDLGADIVFLEAPTSVDEMRAFCQIASVPALANMLEQGQTPVLSPSELQGIGFKIAAYPLTLLNSAISAMRAALAALSKGESVPGLLGFDQLREVVGFPEYDAERERYG